MSARGSHRATTSAITACLLANPGATRDEVGEITGLSAPTVSAALARIAEYDKGSWPRKFRLRTTYVLPEPIAATPPTKIPVENGWGAWARAVMSWPNAIGQLSRSTDPREIAQGLSNMATSAAALAAVFMQVADEPDWLERIGGSIADAD